jgi:hypothetical protein
LSLIERDKQGRRLLDNILIALQYLEGKIEEEKEDQDELFEKI